jgi:TP901 family phage tail tape measure protein
MASKSPPPLYITIKGVDKVSAVLDKTAGKLKYVGGKMISFNNQVLGKLALPAMAVGAVSTKMAIDFKELMGSIQGTLNNSFEENTARAKDLEKFIMDVSNKYGVSATQIAEGTYDIISGMGDMKGATEATTKAMIELAKVGGPSGTVKDAFSVVYAGASGMGDTSIEARDKMKAMAAVAIKTGKTTLPEMAQGLFRVTGSARALGIKIEELMGANQALILTGTKQDEVFTMLDGTMRGLIKPSEDMKKIFHILGVSTGEQLVAKFGGLDGALKAVTKTVKQYGGEVSDLVEAQGVKGINALTILNNKDFIKSTKEMYDAQSKFNDILKNKEEGVGKDALAMKQSIESMKNMAIVIGSELLPILGEFSKQYLIPILNTLNELSPASKKAFVYGGLGIATLYLTVGALGNVAKGLGSILTLLKQIGAAEGLKKLLTLGGSIPGVSTAASKAGGAASAGKNLLSKVGRFGPLAGAVGSGLGLAYLATEWGGTIKGASAMANARAKKGDELESINRILQSQRTNNSASNTLADKILNSNGTVGTLDINFKNTPPGTSVSANTPAVSIFDLSTNVSLGLNGAH